jgi:hypothetical protein
MHFRQREIQVLLTQVMVYLLGSVLSWVAVVVGWGDLALLHAHHFVLIGGAGGVAICALLATLNMRVLDQLLASDESEVNPGSTKEATYVRSRGALFVYGRMSIAMGLGVAILASLPVFAARWPSWLHG